MTHDNDIKSAKAEFANFLSGRVSQGHAVRVQVPKVDVKSIREDLDMSQSDFSSAFALRLNSVRNWEQGIREPDSAARAYLLIIKHAPEMVMKILAQEFGGAFTEALSGSGPVALGENVKPFDPKPKNKPKNMDSQTLPSEQTTAGISTIPAKAISKLLPTTEQRSGPWAASSSSNKSKFDTQVTGPLALADFGFATAEFTGTSDAQVSVSGLHGLGFCSLSLNGHEYSLQNLEDGTQRVGDLGLSEFAALMADEAIDVTICKENTSSK